MYFSWTEFVLAVNEDFTRLECDLNSQDKTAQIKGDSNQDVFLSHAVRLRIIFSQSGVIHF